jgi:hypothetical protein
MTPTGITPELARAIVPVLDLVLATPRLDTDTERRTTWLRMRLVELAPELAPATAPSILDSTRLVLEQALIA